MVQAAEVADDRRQGRRDDHVVQHGQQHRDDQAAHRDHDLSVGELGRAAVRHLGRGVLAAAAETADLILPGFSAAVTGRASVRS
jgi:hypothetical protein